MGEVIEIIHRWIEMCEYCNCTAFKIYWTDSTYTAFDFYRCLDCGADYYFYKELISRTKKQMEKEIKQQDKNNA